MSKNVNRLFKQFSPKEYDLKIKISEDKKNFTGMVVITGEKTGRPTQRITLHQKKLTIGKIKVFQTSKDGEKALKPTRIVKQNKFDELRIHFGKDIYPSDLKLQISFSGKITDNMEGIYPSYFEDEKDKKIIIGTQFESHSAREAFPCIDEPEAKAKFLLTITSNKSDTILGNTPEINKHTDGDRKTISFAKTPVMSTYLLAFVAGELESLQTKSTNGVLIRTFATKNQIKNTQFALDVAAKCLDFYEDYFDIKYPLDKCDFVALPDFASGAMENWGLITFREQALLVDKDHTSSGTKQFVALVVAHELTHQWFGNLVTMRWWTDLWLNEGFASWMSYLAVDKLFPKWDLWTQFAVDEQQPALKLDALKHTHPVQVPIHNPDEIRSIFDNISYEKGASVLHMLQDYLGAEVFRDGLRHYLNKFSYKNTDTSDLWLALEAVSNKNVSEFMSVWTEKPGYPLLEVSKDNDHLHIAQTRFVISPTSISRKDNTVWPIPLLSKGLDRPVITKNVENVVITESVEALKLNDNQGGFYRVIYSDAIEKELLSRLKDDKIGAIDRMGLLSDSFEATKAGYQQIDKFLNLLNEYKNEDSLNTWGIIASSLSNIRGILSKSDTDETLRDLLKPYIDKLVKNQVTRLGWNENSSEKHLDTLLRPLILSMSAIAENKTTIDKCLMLFNNKVNKGEAIHPDLRGLIYTTAVRHSEEYLFDRFVQMYKETDSSEEKLSITAAITSFKDTKSHKKVLELIKSDMIKPQDIGYWLAYSFTNRYGRKLTWKWLRENWQWLEDTIGTDLSFFRMPIYVARNFSDPNFKKEFQDFFSQHLTPTLQRSFDQGLELIDINSAWRKRDADIAIKWFKAQ